MQRQLSRQHDSPKSTSGVTVTRDGDVDRWTARVSETFVPLDAKPIGAEPFYGELRTVHRGPLLIAHITGSAQEVRHGLHQIAAQKEAAVYLNLQIDGIGQVCSRQGEAETTPGSGAIVPAEEIFTLRFERAFSQLCVAMPEKWFSDRLGSPATSLKYRQLQTSRGLGRVIPAAISAVIEAQTEDEVLLCGDLLGRALTDAMRLQQPATVSNLRSDRLFVAIQELIKVSFGEINLTPAKAAATLGCSLSTLHLHCQRGGQSFATMLMRARLDAAVLLLRSTSSDVGRIEAIAFTCGFADPSHFTRRFKNRFGTTPSLYWKRV